MIVSEGSSLCPAWRAMAGKGWSLHTGTGKAGAFAYTGAGKGWSLRLLTLTVALAGSPF